MFRIVFVILASSALTVSSQAARADESRELQPDLAGYTGTIAPFFKDYCVSCHTGKEPQGDFTVDQAGLPNDFLDKSATHRWKSIVNVLNGYEMPPKNSKQPSSTEVAAVVDWVTTQTARAERVRRSNSVTLRRLNREEYRNSIRDLTGVDFDVSIFPQDPSAGGFDNNGDAMTLSPLQIDLYLTAARQILDQALVTGTRPKKVLWRFDPKVSELDKRRVRLDAINNPILNGGYHNKSDGDWIVVHTLELETVITAKDFRVPVAGDYLIRIKAANEIPTRSEVVHSAEAILAQHRAENDQKHPQNIAINKAQYEHDLRHFRTDPMYDYGPARIRLSVQLGPLTNVIGEFDVEGTKEKPLLYAYQTRFTTESPSVYIQYAYSIPAVPENAWFQYRKEFARPELLVDWFEIEGPIYDSWPPTSHMNILFDSPQKNTDERAYAYEVLARFMRQAYRRPVTTGEITEKLKIYDLAKKDRSLSFIEAIKQPLASILVSPKFLFLVENAGGIDATSRTLTDHELAARLSYFLWSASPDAELSHLADDGKLSDQAELQKQAERLLADPRRAAFVTNFVGQWLGLREVGYNPPAADYFPQYDRHLEISIVGESEQFFETILVEDLDVCNFIRSDFVVINERLARFYGIPNVRGDEFRKVSVPANVHRGGLPTQASMLTITSNGTRTSPVKRGTWILKNLLGTDPGLPVSNAGEIAPKVPGIDRATVRKRLEIHRQLDQCARCHSKIDPLGLALENFNGVGEWRDREASGHRGRLNPSDPKIDASGQMPDGTKFVGVAGLQDVLMKQEDLFLHNLASKVFTYALGRELSIADQPTIEGAVTHMKENGRTLKSLMFYVVSSEPFRTK